MNNLNDYDVKVKPEDSTIDDNVNDEENIGF